MQTYHMTNRMVKNANAIQKTNLLTNAICAGINRAEYHGYTKQADIALMVKAELDKYFRIHLKKEYKVETYDEIAPQCFG